MKKPVIILGDGGHAKVLMDTLSLLSVRILDVVERSKESKVLKHSPDKIHLVNGIGMIRPGSSRHKAFKRFKAKGYRFASVIHPTAVIAKDVKLGEGVQVMAGAVIQVGACVGDDVIVNTRASVDHDCVLADHVHIAPGAVLCGSVRIGEGSLVGAGSVVVQGVSVGRNVLVRANSLVKRAVKS